jgi:hypothetical protein
MKKLFGGGRLDHFNLAVEPGFVPVTRVPVDAAFFYGNIYDGKCLGKQALGCFTVFFFDGGPQVFDLGPQGRLVPLIDRVSTQAPSPLA